MTPKARWLRAGRSPFRSESRQSLQGEPRPCRGPRHRARHPFARARRGGPRGSELLSFRANAGWTGPTGDRALTLAQRLRLGARAAGGVFPLSLRKPPVAPGGTPPWPRPAASGTAPVRAGVEGRSPSERVAAFPSERGRTAPTGARAILCGSVPGTSGCTISPVCARSREGQPPAVSELRISERTRVNRPDRRPRPHVGAAPATRRAGCGRGFPLSLRKPPVAPGGTPPLPRSRAALVQSGAARCPAPPVLDFGPALGWSDWT
jgi:hypothetical protein